MGWGRYEDLTICEATCPICPKVDAHSLPIPMSIEHVYLVHYWMVDTLISTYNDINSNVMFITMK